MADSAKSGSRGVPDGLPVSGRVEMWRGFCRSDISVSAPFVWRVPCGSTVAPLPRRTPITVLRSIRKGKHLPSPEGDPPPTARRDMVVLPLGERGSLHEAASPFILTGAVNA